MKRERAKIKLQICLPNLKEIGFDYLTIDNEGVSYNKRFSTKDDHILYYYDAVIVKMVYLCKEGVNVEKIKYDGIISLATNLKMSYSMFQMLEASLFYLCQKKITDVIFENTDTIANVIEKTNRCIENKDKHLSIEYIFQRFNRNDLLFGEFISHAKAINDVNYFLSNIIYCLHYFYELEMKYCNINRKFRLSNGHHLLYHADLKFIEYLTDKIKDYYIAQHKTLNDKIREYGLNDK